MPAANACGYASTESIASSVLARLSISSCAIRALFGSVRNSAVFGFVFCSSASFRFLALASSSGTALSACATFMRKTLLRHSSFCFCISANSFRICSTDRLALSESDSVEGSGISPCPVASHAAPASTGAGSIPVSSNVLTVPIASTLITVLPSTARRPVSFHLLSP